jgi:glycosyltransferase involved in cell wall biosynthesis
VRRLGIPDLGGLAEPDTGETLRVLSASSMDSNKRVELIAASVAEIGRTGQRVHWTHFGDGPKRDAVAAVVSTFPPAATAELPGHVGSEVVRDSMLQGGWDVFVNLSLSEGVPVSLMEAQCVGLPVVATDVGGSPEVAPYDLNELVGVGARASSIAERILCAANSSPGMAVERRLRWAQSFDSDVAYRSFAAELRGLCG